MYLATYSDTNAAHEMVLVLNISVLMCQKTIYTQLGRWFKSFPFDKLEARYGLMESQGGSAPVRRSVRRPSSWWILLRNNGRCNRRSI